MENGNIKRNSIYNSIKSFLQVIFPLITFPYISRMLQVEGVGKINFSSSVMNYFIMIASLGVNTYAIRECAKVKNDREKLGQVASEIFSIDVITTAISYFALIVTVALVPRLHDYWALLLIHSFTMLFTTLGTDWLNTAVEDFRYLTIRYAVFQLTGLILMFLLVRDIEDYLIYAIITVLAGSGAEIVNIWYRTRFCRVRFLPNRNILRHIVPILTLFSMMFAQQILAASDTVIIGFVYGDYEVGLYSVAVRISRMVDMVIASVTWVVMPQLSKGFADKNFDAVKKIINYGINFMSTCGIPCVVGMFMMAPEIIGLVAGPTYSAASIVLRILSVSMAISYIGNVIFNMCLLASGKDKICAVLCIITTIINIVLNLIFIPQFGIAAAAMATVVSQLLSLICALCFVDRCLIDKSYGKTLTGPVLGGIGVWLCTLMARVMVSNSIVRLGIAVGSSGLVYLIIMLITKNDLVMSLLNRMWCKNKDRNEVSR